MTREERKNRRAEIVKAIEGGMKVAEVMSQYGVSDAMIYNALKEFKKPKEPKQSKVESKKVEPPKVEKPRVETFPKIVTDQIKGDWREVVIKI